MLFIHIPEYSDKPVFIRGCDVFESYKRSAGQTVKQTKHEVKQIISISTGLRYEEQVATNEINGDNVLKLIDYDRYFVMLEKKLPETKEAILSTLENEELIKKVGANWNILNLGVILFARNIKEFKDIKRKSIRVITYKNTDRINATKEQEGGVGFAIGFKGLISYIMNQFPSNEIIETAIREQVKLYPEKAVREFVANAIIHQDFYASGTCVLVEIFSDRIEITNPGVPLVDTNRFIDTAPKSRNEIFASFMRRLKICEERGSGVDRAIEAIEAFQLPAPKFIRGDDYTRVIMYAPVPLTRMCTEDRIRACYQHTCLNYVNNKIVNNQSVRKRFKIGVNNSSFATKIITETIEAGLIKVSDPKNTSKKYASYIPFWG